MLRILQHFFQS